MPNRHHHAPTEEDAAVSWARRRETVRGALKMFRVLLDAVRRHADWVEDRHGIRASQLWTLWELHHSPGMRAVDLSRNMAIHRHSAEELLRDLASQGLIRAENNGDVATYFLTRHGQQIVEAELEHGQGVVKAALERLPDSALEQVVGAMRVLNECLPFREDRAALKPLADLVRPERESKHP